jgi:hypothetical protein
MPLPVSSPLRFVHYIFQKTEHEFGVLKSFCNGQICFCWVLLITGIFIITEKSYQLMKMISV